MSQYGNRMAFTHVEDETGICGAVFFPKAWGEYEDLVEMARDSLMVFGVVQGPPYTDTLMVHGVDSV